MNIAAIQYSLDNLALEIYLAGCKEPHCEGCHNPDLWDFENGAPLSDWEPVIRTYATAYGGEINMVKNIWVLGGEPLDQHHGRLLELLMFLRGLFRDSKVWLFTRRKYDQIPRQIIQQCHYIKTGAYKQGLPPLVVEIDGNKLTLGSYNQGVHRCQK